MLDYIRGRVINKSPTRLTMDVAGIGYLLSIPLSTFEKVPSHGEVTVYTQVLIREDRIRVFGFATTEERELFNLLMSVNGVGPNTAIMILSGSSVTDIKHAILEEDVSALGKIKGVGRKTAERIILELKGQIKEIALPTTSRADADDEQKTIISDAVMALISLGYGRSGAERAVNEAAKKLQGVDNIELLIKEALKYKA